MLKRLNIYFKEMYPFFTRLVLGFILFLEIFFMIYLNMVESDASFPKFTLAKLDVPELLVGGFTIFCFLMFLRIADDSKDYELDTQGNETGRYKIMCGVPLYGGKVDVVPCYAINEGVINAVSQYWTEGDTVKANGRLNFSSRTETVITEVDFGEPVEETKTINVSELIITGGSQTPLDGEFAFDFEDIKKGLVDRKTRLEAQKEKDMSRAKHRATPAPATEVSNSLQDLGF